MTLTPSGGVGRENRAESQDPPRIRRRKSVHVCIACEGACLGLQALEAMEASPSFRG